MKRIVLTGLAALLLTAGCARNQSMFVLVPDRDGTVGEITVTNEGGAVTLSKAGESVAIAGAAAAPGKTKVLTDEEIQGAFGEAIEAEPPAPKVFTLRFKSGSAELGGDAANIIAEAAAEVKARDSRDIAVNGHTDTAGNAQYNMQLSLRRAHQVRDLLVEQGVSADYITVDYHGEGDPLVPTGDNINEPKNRRVEVIVR